MINLSLCPQCRRMVTLPEASEPSTIVRCPLCQAEYALSEVLALVPPALILVPRKANAVSPAPAFKPVSGLVTEPFFAPCQTAAPSTDELIEEISFEETPDSEPAEDFTFDFQAQPAEGEQPTESEQLPEADYPAEVEPLFTEQKEPAEVPAAAVPSAENSSLAEKPLLEEAQQKNHVSEGPKEPPRIKPLVKPLPTRRTRGKKGPIRMVFELVPSVGVGLLIAYYGVWWIRGESAGLPRFDWLPFLPSEEYIARAPAKTTPPAKPANALPANPAPAIAAPQPQATTTSIAKNEPAANTAAPASTETAAKNEPVIEKTASDVASPGTLPSVAENKTPSATASNEPPPPKVGPRPPAIFTSLDLDTAIQEATDAIFANNGTGKVNANSYPAFCRLAQIQTLIAPEKQVPAQRRLVEETILGNIAKDPQQVTEIGQLAGETMKKADQQKGGILLAGKITNIKTRDNMHGAIVSLAGSGQKVAIIFGKPLNFKIDDEVLVTGVMVVNPAENLPGFTGTSPLVIWAGTIVPVPAVATDAK